jgi:anti-anti-sigma factor
MGPDTTSRHDAPGQPRGEIRVLPDPADLPGFSAEILLLGEHDIATAPELATAISAIEGSVLVDLGACTFLDSSVIGVLFSAARTRAQEGTRLELVAPPGNAAVVRTLELVHVRSALVVHEQRPG